MEPENDKSKREALDYINYLRAHNIPGDGPISIREPGSEFLEEFIMDFSLFQRLHQRLQSHCHLCPGEITKKGSKETQTKVQEVFRRLQHGEGIPDDWKPMKGKKHRFKKDTGYKAAGGGLWICPMEDCFSFRADTSQRRTRAGDGGVHRIYCRRCIVQRLDIDFPTLFHNVEGQWVQKMGPAFNICLHCSGFAGQEGGGCIARSCKNPCTTEEPRRRRRDEEGVRARGTRHRGLPREDGPADRDQRVPREPRPPPPERQISEDHDDEDGVPTYGGAPARGMVGKSGSPSTCFLSFGAYGCQTFHFPPQDLSLHTWAVFCHS